MLYALINDQEFPVRELSLNRRQKQIGEFEFTLEASRITGNPNDLLFADVAVFRDGNRVISGIVSSYPQPVMVDGQMGYYRLSCDEEVGRLYLEIPLNIQFQNIAIATCISTLLAGATGSAWLVNNISTLVNDTVVVDVRDRESLWAQVECVLEQAGTATYWRYGGFSGGFHLLDLGRFGEQPHNYTAVQGDNVSGKIRFKQSTRLPIKEIRPISGKVGNMPVNLSDALVLVPGLAADPNYPLVAATQSILNNTVPNGRRMRKRFTEQKTKNTVPPTNVEKQQAALSLYRRSVREIISNASTQALDFTVSLPFIPNLNAKMFVQGQVMETIFDVYTGQHVQRETIAVSDWYRITGIKTKLLEPVVVIDPVTEELETVYVLELSLTNGDDADIYDEESLLLERLATNDLQDNTGTVLSISDSYAVIVNQNAVGANCNWSGVNTGRLFVFPMPPVPAYATNVIASVASVSPVNVTWNVVAAAALPATNLQLCVSGNGPVPWTVADNVTITVVYSFA